MLADEPAIQSDAYIDALLNGHARLPISIAGSDSAPEPNVRHVIRVLEETGQIVMSRGNDELVV